MKQTPSSKPQTATTVLRHGLPLLFALNAWAAPSLNGQVGYINTPSAHVGDDGTFSLGIASDKPYTTLWTSTTVLPWLEVSGRYTSIAGIPGFADQQYGSGYGRFKDKAIDLKFALLDETANRPALAVGLTDIQGTQLWKSRYLVASKSWLPGLETSIGYGSERIDGLFGGIRFTPQSHPNWSLLAEYDGTDYRRDPFQQQTAAAKRDKGPALGIEYQWGWLGVQLARHKSHASINAHIDIPLNVREFVPKIQEPGFYSGSKEVPVRPSLAQWQAESRYRQSLAAALAGQDYKNIRIAMTGHSLVLELGNSRISNVGRAIGRAVRTALYFAPLETRELRVVYLEQDLPVATYSFFDLPALSDYLRGKIDRQRFLDTVSIKPARDNEVATLPDQALSQSLQQDVQINILNNEDGSPIRISSDDSENNRFRLSPKTGVFFNDPSGAFRYEIAAAASYTRRLGQGLYFDSAFSTNIYNTVSGVKQPSNSLLPHVRSDVADYKRTDTPKVDRLLLNQLLPLGSNLYARASAGIYEEMFRGFGGQLLYYPRAKHWAVDLSVDALQQRDTKGWFGHRDYRTVSGIASLHYQLPLDITATARAGRFLAKDKGVRLELKRRFRSGVEAGFWYTKTNGNDITSPGTPSRPYNDKGLFFSIPLNSLLTFDTRSVGNFSLSPWTRDVGQMVLSPGDLYDILSNPRRDMNAYDGLGNFAERPDEQELPQVTPPMPGYQPWPAIRLRLEDSATQWLDYEHKGTLLGIGAAAVLASSALDRPLDRRLQRHQQNRWLTRWDKLGDALPLAATTLAAGAFALGEERLSNTGLIALQANAGAFAASKLFKGVINRSRPTTSDTPWQQQSAGQSRFQSSLPSSHAAALFATVTPFAEEYDQPWLYGVAALGASSRVAQRQHWLSDTVAGSALGYLAGRWLWQAQRNDQRYRTQLALAPGQVGLHISTNLP